MKKKWLIINFLVLVFLIIKGTVFPASISKPPKNPSGTAYYLFYLHGLIIENSGIRPKHPRHGYYEYEKILRELEKRGFIVISEAREQRTKVKEYANKIVSQIEYLLDKKIPPAHITVVGASKGGIITAYISGILKNRDINYVILAGLFKQLLKNEELKLFGNVLSVHDSSDLASIVPDEFFKRSTEIGRHKKIVTNLKLGHGLLFKPYSQWVDPLVKWSGIIKEKK